MISTIVIEFQKVTKYPLINFLVKYRDFMSNSFPQIDRYFGGEIENIESIHLNKLKIITSDCQDVLAQFKVFSNKFSNCGYWELMDYLDSLNTVIEKINKLPKFKRTSLTKRGYQPYIQVKTSIGGFRTVEDVAGSIKKLNKDNSNWIDLMINNDLNEVDWDIEDLSTLNAFINNKKDVVVTTILDMPVGKRIYGKDILRKISFSDNDLTLVNYEKNIEQKCDIILELDRGDIPENPMLGLNRNLISGVSYAQFAYPQIANEISDNFMQNDLFESATIKDFSLENGDMVITVDIKTKYDYRTEKKVII